MKKYDVFETYMETRFNSTEGESRVRNMTDMVEAMGYGQDRWSRGRALEEFLADNPGAIEALLEFIEEHIDGAPEWQEGLASEVEIEDDFDDLTRTTLEDE